MLRRTQAARAVMAALAVAVAVGVATGQGAGAPTLVSGTSRRAIASNGITQIESAVLADGPAARGAREQISPFPPAPPVANATLAGCDSGVLQALVTTNRTARQWIIVLTPSVQSTSATLQIATLGTDDVWHCSLAATDAEIGRGGIRPLVDRRSGDGTTPAGIFPLGSVNTPQGPVSFFGNSDDPGVLGAYRLVQPDDCYGANPNTVGYGHWRSDIAGCVGDDELLASSGAAYEHAVLIGANTEPNVSGDAPGEAPYASAIFLHRLSYTSSGVLKPTSGCVSIGHAALLTAVRTIDPRLATHFAIGTRASFTG